MKIHKEGGGIILGACLLTVVLVFFFSYISDFNSYVLGGSIIAGIFYLIFVFRFFRVPTRILEANERFIIAPCDGKVVVIEETVEEEYFKKERRQISIFMSPLDVHVNYAPVSGLLKFFKYHSGKFLAAWHPKSSTLNERTTLVAETLNGTEILFRQIAGALAKRIRVYINEGESLEQGKEFGFIKFGSRMDVFIPMDATVKVKLNQKVRGGETILAELNPNA